MSQIQTTEQFRIVWLNQDGVENGLTDEFDTLNAAKDFFAQIAAGYPGVRYRIEHRVCRTYVRVGDWEPLS